MIQQFFIYFVVGALLAWPTWKLAWALIHRSGLYKPKSRCFEAYLPAGSLHLTHQPAAETNRV